MKKLLLYIIVAALTITSSVILPSAQSAAQGEECDVEFYHTNDIIYFNPCSTVGCSLGQENAITDQKLGDAKIIETIYTYLTSTPLSTNGGKPLNPAQAAGIMGNFQAESSFDPSAVEATSRADKGHGLAQWTFGRWDALEAFAADQGKPWNTVDVQLDYLKKELEGAEKAVLSDSEFASSNDPGVTALRWRIVFERADPNLSHDDRRQSAAIAVYKMFGGEAASTCTPGGGGVPGDIVRTALNFALEKPAIVGMSQKSDARDTYQKAKEELNPGPLWSDCGGYVATVMISSGVDKNYPLSGVAPNQMPYVKAHPEKYIIIDNPTIGELEPGDILYMDAGSSAHTAIYTGEAQYPMVDASLSQRVPSVRTMDSLKWMLDQPNSMAARVIK